MTQWPQLTASLSGPRLQCPAAAGPAESPSGTVTGRSESEAGDIGSGSDDQHHRDRAASEAAAAAGPGLSGAARRLAAAGRVRPGDSVPGMMPCSVTVTQAARRRMMMIIGPRARSQPAAV